MTPNSRKSPKLALSLLLLWIAAITFAFVGFDLEHFYLQKTGPESKTYLFESQAIKGLSTQQPEIIHFWQPDCPCAPLIKDHIRKLIASAAKTNIPSRIITMKNSHETETETRERLSREFGQHAAIQIVDLHWPTFRLIPASPSAAVINKMGETTYFGPYTSDAYCSTENEAFVETALKNANKRKEPVDETNNLATGCLCPWE